MSAETTVSVIVPTYDSADTVAEALQSIRDQTFGDCEIIVVDDASSDGTADVARRVTEAWANARVIERGCNGGPAAARNRGLAEARGEWVAFLDGDDAWFPWRLAAQFEVLEQFPEAVLVCGEVCYFGDPEPAVPAVAAEACRDVQLLDFLEQNPVSTSTVLARAESIRAAGMFDEQFRGPEDIDLWMRVAAAGQIVCLKEAVTKYRERPGSLSMDPDRFLPQILRVYDKAFGIGGALYEHRHLHRRCAASRHVSAAWTYLACGQRAKALRVLLRSWCLWPGRLAIEEKRAAWRLMILRNIILNRT